MRLTKFCPCKMMFGSRVGCLFLTNNGAKVVLYESPVKVRFGNSFFAIFNLLIINTY
jgi:hypothetical protein